MESPRVVLTVTTPAAGRGPVTAGVPWPRGVVTDAARLALTDAAGRPVPLQAKVTDRWADGSARWVLLDWIAESGAGPYTLFVGDQSRLEGRNLAERTGNAVWVHPGAALFIVRPGSCFPFMSVALAVGTGVSPEPSPRGFLVTDGNGHTWLADVRTVEIEAPGPCRSILHLTGQLVSEQGSRSDSLLDFDARIHFFSGSTVVRVEFTLRNPRRAEHPGGLWDLGDPGSVFLKDASITFALPEGRGGELRYSPERGAPVVPYPLPFELFQASSGGENWNGRNHVTRAGTVTLPFRGYRLNAASGRRATPIVLLPGLGVTTEHFWENFPKAIEATADAITLRLFPQQAGDLHELQGGEQKTHTFAVAFGADATAEALEWFRTPPRVTLPPEWVAATGAVPYLTPQATDPHADYLALVGAALDGPDTFVQKRETIDEYGWRHFGDIWGDHEAVYDAGPAPMVSHYNNQYDPVFGFGVQLLRSGDPRWAEHMDALAAHVADIDIYHTTRDKAAYNGGLFWHTYHYAPADTATHRSYPKLLRTLGGPAGLDPNDPKAKKSKHVYALGGGPGNEQNYAAGLALHYFLTGSEQSRAAAIGLAQWVIDMDDGSKTVFRWLARGDTGLASQSRGPEYHGPGRGSGNSLAALLVGHTLTGDAKFLAKAERLIRRVVHPADDVPARKLLDVENRWFYTMFLHSLGKYLDHKAELGQLDAMYAYARASLLHYARWMADHEVPTLSRPDILEYPNETWAAQDVRKFEVLRLAARHAGPDAERFRERARFFFSDSIARLTAFPTRTLCRPVVLLLSLGYTAACPADAAPPPAVAVTDFGRPERFVPQKQTALKRAKLLVAAGAVVGFAAVVALGVWLLAG
ncbi:RIFT barrel domain-containing protein [Urbifossiella limnaea]|uniref:PcRGLX/YetA-like N-terminal RIFT barrel domain-containing protein n=1 Tax=Urbifossiella limnaea TaxID=2528023 RepID=A0A517Y2J0_9BACT|nr:hypothetical protein [Urbifossiella limnaea]QDU23918.1 hypothetical protein ETAA1_59290 [Urbifossiella limnaea]